MTDPIQNFIKDYTELKEFLFVQGQISMANEVDDHFRKVLLLSSASFFETEIQNIIVDFVSNHSNDSKVVQFLKNKAIMRQYHTYFNWKDKNANSFFGLFGDEFKCKITQEMNGNDDLKDKMKAFMELGNERNKMVHENFLSYNLQKTFDEIVSMYEKSKEFVEYIKKELC